jgi:hypothetical protein
VLTRPMVAEAQHGRNLPAHRCPSLPVAKSSVGDFVKAVQRARAAAV